MGLMFTCLILLVGCASTTGVPPLFRQPSTVSEDITPQLKEPPSQPFLRIEIGSHIDSILTAGVDSTGRILLTG